MEYLTKAELEILQENLIYLVSRQMKKIDMSLTYERQNEMEFMLMGMQKAIREIINRDSYNYIMEEAEKEARQ